MVIWSVKIKSLIINRIKMLPPTVKIAKTVGFLLSSCLCYTLLHYKNCLIHWLFFCFKVNNCDLCLLCWHNFENNIGSKKNWGIFQKNRMISRNNWVFLHWNPEIILLHHWNSASIKQWNRLIYSNRTVTYSNQTVACRRVI